MTIAVLVLLAAAAAAALLLWRAARPPRSPRNGPWLPGIDESDPSGFVFRPAPVPDDRPPRARSLLLIALVVAIVAAIGAGVLWSIGYLVNQQLARLVTR